MNVDMTTLAAAIGVVKGIPDTAAAAALAAAEDAAEAAENAEASATLAAQHSMGVSVSGTTLVFSQLGGE